jgi:ATP-dependent Clp protease ATP-binding subunit ClpA
MSEDPHAERNARNSRKRDVSADDAFDQNLRFLSQFGVNLTERAIEGKIDQVVGRDDEIRRVFQILGRRSKNTPVLVGEPGVGKTAIAEGLAY